MTLLKRLSQVDERPDDPQAFITPSTPPLDIARWGQQALRDGWDLARLYFQAAIDQALAHSEAWTLAKWFRVKRPIVTHPVTVKSYRLSLSLHRELVHAHRQLTLVFAPVWAQLNRWCHPFRPADMRRWLMLLLIGDALLWGGVLGLFGLSTVEGSARLGVQGVTARTVPQVVAVNVVQTATAIPFTGAEPTLPPMLTATPIPWAEAMWTPYLPGEPGWSGEATCSGEFLAQPGTGIFAWPTDQHYLSGYDYSWWHTGLDITTWLGDNIYAADAGIVVYAGWNIWGYGNLIVIDHGNGWHTLYAHLSQINVTCGQAVEQGVVVGLAGSTGHSTGPHLHFEMRHEGEGRVNPWGYLP